MNWCIGFAILFIINLVFYYSITRCVCSKLNYDKDLSNKLGWITSFILFVYSLYVFFVVVMLMITHTYYDPILSLSLVYFSGLFVFLPTILMLILGSKYFFIRKTLEPALEIAKQKVAPILFEDEECLYLAPKDSASIGFVLVLSIFVSLGVALFFLFILVCHSGLKDNLLFTMLIVFFELTIFWFMRDAFFSDVIFTNKRIILNRFNKFDSIGYDEIKMISPLTTITSTFINSYRGCCRILFVDGSFVELMVKELYPEYKAHLTTKDKIYNFIIVVLFIVIYIVFFCSFS